MVSVGVGYNDYDRLTCQSQLLEYGFALYQSRQLVSVEEKSSSVPIKVAVRLYGIGVIRLVVVDTKFGKVRRQIITKSAGHHLLPFDKYFTSSQLFPQGQD